MKGIISYIGIAVLLFSTTSIDSPTHKPNVEAQEKTVLKYTPKLIEEIKKLDTLEYRIDKLLSEKGIK